MPYYRLPGRHEGIPVGHSPSVCLTRILERVLYYMGFFRTSHFEKHGRRIGILGLRAGLRSIWDFKYMVVAWVLWASGQD